ncbi:MAG: DNA-directed RNA polymerase sigma-70 factor [Saprospiraceae bacterium]|nr:MAG: DNA-directed RNA polymerase sigma-70 factor [Saprospiraceae bacterium]
MSEKELVEACLRGERKAQRELYEQYAPLMLAVCRRYVGTLEDAEDVMIEGFWKVFHKLDSYKGEGSFEGWIRRIMINECLMFLRRKDPLRFSAEISDRREFTREPSVVSRLQTEQILALLDELPSGYRTVFNLYAIEGYKHREIAELLGISINTSKSQYLLARARLTELLASRLGIHKPDHGT